MLNEVRDKYFNKIIISLDLQKANKELLQDFQNISKKSPGNCVLHFDLKDPQENVNLRLLSTKVKFSPQNDILQWLDEEGFAYRIN